ncbi:MAG TPA: ABC transporter permease [Pyrinomonadaceae bacterium]|nr:ABC transporter permease [Pyrinomonadaceae bacterium]
MDNLVTANIRQRPLRSLVSVAGVALGVALIMLFTGLSRGMSNDLKRRSQNLRAEIIFTRPGSMELTSSTANLSTRYVERLQAIEGVESAVPVIRYISQGRGGFGLEQIEGVDWEPFAKMNGIQLVEGRAPQAVDPTVEGDPNTPGEVVIDERKAESNNLSVGSTVKLFGDKPFKVVGIYAPESGARVKMSLSAMQRELESADKCQYILVKARDGVDELTLARRIESSPETQGNKIQFTRDVFKGIENSIPFLGVFLRVLVGLAAVVSALVVMLAMYTTITERTREIGILKALGASRSYIVGVIEKEAALISVLGLVAGFAIALVAGFLIQRAYGLVFEYGWGWALTAAAIGLLGGVLGALYPAVRAANLDPVSAISYD